MSHRTFSNVLLVLSGAALLDAGFVGCELGRTLTVPICFQFFLGSIGIGWGLGCLKSGL